MKNIEALNVQTYTCPISGLVFNDPVIACDGHTYDRENIEEWFNTSETSPITGSIIKKILITNNDKYSIICSIIDQYNSGKINKVKHFKRSYNGVTGIEIINPFFEEHNTLKNQIEISEGRNTIYMNALERQIIEIVKYNYQVICLCSIVIVFLSQYLCSSTKHTDLGDIGICFGCIIFINFSVSLIKLINKNEPSIYTC
jgi:hypothetical protein